MSVKPIDFLNSATSLASSGNDEMTQRNVISRAYYAAYHRACELIEPENSDENIGVHARYIKQLMMGNNGSIERKIGGKIKSMYSRRKIADYFIRDELKSDASALQLNAAKDLFSVIAGEELKPPPQSTPNNGTTQQSKPTLRIVK
ncbi:MAG TPA: hypothetical protein VIY48_08855 [Candidatus Paceibacterota bacterium]